MLDLLRPAPAASITPATAAALAQAAAAFARLDQALENHPLTPAFLHRVRLEAVRRQAAADGFAIDPWHLAALLEGLRLRMEASLRIADRGAIFDAARHALTQHQWLVTPDFDQEGEIRRAAAGLAAAPGTPLLAAAHASHAWLQNGGGGAGQGSIGISRWNASGGGAPGGARPPLRAALIRHWTRHRLLRAPVPLTGAAALRYDTSWGLAAWVPEFLTALAAEAADALELLLDLERTWLSARRAVAGRRRTSRAAAAVDILAAVPLVSATSLATGLGMAIKNATELLDRFCVEGLTVEVTHRSKRRLFGLAALAPLRDGVAPPYRPLPGRGRGRPPNIPIEDDGLPLLLPERPLSPLERRAFDTSGLEAAIALRQGGFLQSVRCRSNSSRTSGKGVTWCKYRVRRTSPWCFSSSLPFSSSSSLSRKHGHELVTALANLTPDLSEATIMSEIVEGVLPSLGVQVDGIDQRPVHIESHRFRHCVPHLSLTRVASAGLRHST
jgi:hypothetical protein